MLESITINNIALIDNLTIEFERGLNVLSGETGAGKSLIIGSISLLLGERADKGLISYGKNYASVEAVFSGLSDTVIAQARELGLEEDEKLVIFRKLTVDGKNECRVNGQTFTLSMLKKLTAPLMDLHGQFEHQSLLKVPNHLKVIDDFGKKQIAPILSEYSKIYEQLNLVRAELKNWTVDEKERERMIDLYKYQIEEIENAKFFDGEIEELKSAQLKIAYAEKIAEGLGSVIELLGEGDGLSSAISTLSKAQSILFGLKNYSPELEVFATRIESAKLEVEDIYETLNEKANTQEFDEYEAKRVSERLDLFSSFKKKYGSTVAEINDYLAQIKAEYEKLVNCSEYLSNLVDKKSKLTASLVEIGAKLTEARRASATLFASKVQDELAQLGMRGSQFVVDFSPVEVENALSNGLDKVEFLFSANVGQPARSLVKVISGGEMSRFMLAVKNVTAEIDGIDTMIFDEIDTGVSGNMALVLAQKMQKVGASHQVLCVTHMAQICAFANSNFFISKATSNGGTKTSLKKIEGEEKVKEVARLVGSSSSVSALEHARELIDLGKNNI